MAGLDLAAIESSHFVTYTFYLLQFEVWTLPCFGEEMNTFLIVSLTVVRAVTREMGTLVVNTYRNNPGDTQCESPEKKISDELLEIILETFKEWPFGNQLPHL